MALGPTGASVTAHGAQRTHGGSGLADGSLHEEMGSLLGEPAKAMHGRGEEQQPRDETPPDNRGAEHDPKGAHGEKLARSQLRTIGRKYEPRSARRRLRPRGRGPSRATARAPRFAQRCTPSRPRSQGRDIMQLVCYVL